MTDFVDMHADAAMPTWPAPRAASSPAFGSRSESVLDAEAARRATRPRKATTPKWVLRYRARAIALDLFSAALASLLVTALRLGSDFHSSFLWMALAMPLGWVVAVYVAKGYEARFVGTGPDEYRAIGHAAVGLFCLAAVVSYTGKYELPRSFVLAFFPLAWLLDLACRRYLRLWLGRCREAGAFLQRTVVVGRADSAASLIREVRRAPSQGMNVVGVCVSGLDSTWESDTQVEGVPVFGRPEDAVKAVDLLNANVVAVSSHPDLVGHSLRRLAWALEDRGVDLIVSPGILEVAGPRLSIRQAPGLSLVHVERPVSSGGRMLLKSVIDRIVAVGLIVAALPVLMAVAGGIKLTSPGPVFFRQRRVGSGGEPFSMLKFRTMVVDAEAKLAEFALGQGFDVNSVLFKMKDDPRVTKIGKFLRRYSLDELPQLVNVVRGEMSLVGPRPPLASEVELYEPDAIRRLRVQPGLTGLWQVSGRSDLSWEESLRLDLWYVDNWSLMLDAQILVRTARAVFAGSGAY
ncbi:MAG TPA: sugar transferase [Dermatophilaceae bacterium]|nr:sugar transferase [Dermatophilaceae bacterium]